MNNTMNNPILNSRNLKNKLVGIILFIFIVLIFWAGLMEARARDELSQARQALAASPAEPEKAMRHYFRALHWYSPVGASQTAADEFLTLARQLEKDGSTDLAFSAFIRLRSGLYAARSFYLPRRDILAQVEPNIARQLARQKVGENGSALSYLAQGTFYYSLYSAPVSPREGWAFMAVAGFWLWVTGAVWFIFKFFKPSGMELPLAKRAAAGKTGFLLFCLGYPLWLIGLLYI